MPRPLLQFGNTYGTLPAVPSPVSLTPPQCITLVILNASINQMAAGIAEAEAFCLPEVANALKMALTYVQKDRDRMLAEFSRAVKVVTEMPTNGALVHP